MNFRNDPIFQEIAQKYSRNAPFIGLLGTVFGIVTALMRLESTKGSFDLVGPGIVDALVCSAVGIVILLAVMFLRYWWIKRRR